MADGMREMLRTHQALALTYALTRSIHARLKAWMCGLARLKLYEPRLPPHLRRTTSEGLSVTEVTGHTEHVP